MNFILVNVRCSNLTVSQVKFIKFFAWEERWIAKALDAREAEMK